MTEKPPPSALAIAFGSAIVAGLAGYFLGQAQSIGVFSSSKPISSTAAESDLSDAESASDEEEDEEDDEIKGLEGFEDSDEECKLVLVVRTDLGMTKGSSSPWEKASQENTTDSRYRQNSCTMRSRDTGLL